MRLIDADALYVEVTEKYKDICGGCYPFNIVAYDMAQLVKNAPTIDAVEVVHGRWENVSCTNCGQVDFSKPNYCPNCGAKMDGERKTE